jgi:hypothetical protein
MAVNETKSINKSDLLNISFLDILPFAIVNALRWTLRDDNNMRKEVEVSHAGVKN